jgi:hypothetical protein
MRMFLLPRLFHLFVPLHVSAKLVFILQKMFIIKLKAFGIVHPFHRPFLLMKLFTMKRYRV